MLSEPMVKLSSSSDSRYDLNVTKQISDRSNAETSKLVCVIDSSRSVAFQSIDLPKKDQIYESVGMIERITEKSTVSPPSASELPSEIATTIQTTPPRSVSEIQIQSTPISKTRRSRIQQTPTRNTTPRRHLKRFAGIGILRAGRYCQQNTALSSITQSSSVHHEVDLGGNVSVSSPCSEEGVVDNSVHIATPPSKKHKSISLEDIESHRAVGQESNGMCYMQENYSQQDIRADRVNKEMINSFSVSYHRNLPIISGRLFACYILHEQLSGMDPARFQIIIPFLKALVAVESVSLRPQDAMNLPTQNVAECADHNQSANTPAFAGKRIHFSGIDLSSTLPPVDRVSGSDAHQSDLINVLIKVKLNIDSLIVRSASDPTVLQSLDSLILFFDQTLVMRQSALIDVCAAAVQSDFSPNRIHTVRISYLKEFQRLRRRVDYSQHSDSAVGCDMGIEENPITVNVQSSDIYLDIEHRFANIVGQRIRFYMRMLLNPQPPRLCAEDTSYHNRASLFSKVSKVANLSLVISSQSSVALEDACVSALVSKSLQHIVDLCGTEVFPISMTEAEFDSKLFNTSIVTLPEISETFCDSTASKREISKGPPFIYFDDDDIMEIQHDLHDATSLIVASKSARFLLDLFTCKKVVKEITRLGGWTKIEECARLSRQFKLWQICDSDAHLVPLFSNAQFINRLKEICSHLDKHVDQCESSLLALSKRLRLTTKGKYLQLNYPQLVPVVEAFERCTEDINAIPVVVLGRAKK